VSEIEKINIYVPEQIARTLNDDATLFEVFKRDGFTVNRNRFLSMLIVGYYNLYVSEYQTKYELLRDVIERYVPEISHKKSFADAVLKNIILPEVPKRKGKNPIRLSLKPTDQTESIIIKIMRSMETDDYISQYFCRMFVSYCEKPLFERERIIFRENYENLVMACRAKRPITFSTIWNSRIVHEVLPYDLTSGQDEMFNYLLCQIKNENSGNYEARTYRLNRITQLNSSAKIVLMSNEVSKHLELMKFYGPQYPINDDIETCVKLTDYGLISFNRIYYGRPKYDRTEICHDGQLFYFNCSKDQLFFYFRRFEAGTAEILYPASLRERMIKFHSDALESYKES
jgi:hypothetical protein